MLVEIGKTYEARNGSKIKAVAITGRPGTFAVLCKDQFGRPTWRSLKGRFSRYPTCFDLVREAVDADRNA
jgi:hypothetical protein